MQTIIFMNPVTRFICIKSMWYIRWIGSFIKHNLKQRKTLITIYFTNNILCTYLYIITWIKNEKNATTTFSHHQCWVYIWNCSKKCCIDSNLSIFIHFFFIYLSLLTFYEHHSNLWQNYIGRWTILNFNFILFSSYSC